MNWKKSYLNGYEVSSCGKIRSLDRYITRSDTGALVLYKGKILKQQADKRGYLRVRLSLNNLKIGIIMHRLIAQTFIPNPDNLPQVNHKDGNKKHNNVSNLEWCTNQENQLHAIKTGLKTFKVGESSHLFTGAVQAFDKEGNLKYTMSGNLEMKQFGFDYRLVSACLVGKRKSHNGHTFKKLTKEIK